MGGAYVRNWGIALQDISQAQDFGNQPIQVTAGMSAGLPFATLQSVQLSRHAFGHGMICVCRNPSVPIRHKNFEPNFRKG